MEIHPIPESPIGGYIYSLEQDAQDIIRMGDAIKGLLQLRVGNGIVGLTAQEYLDQLTNLVLAVKPSTTEGVIPGGGAAG